MSDKGDCARRVLHGKLLEPLRGAIGPVLGFRTRPAFDRRGWPDMLSEKLGCLFRPQDSAVVDVANLRAPGGGLGGNLIDGSTAAIGEWAGGVHVALVSLTVAHEIQLHPTKCYPRNTFRFQSATPQKRHKLVWHWNQGSHRRGYTAASPLFLRRGIYQSTKRLSGG
jgi:hypothetical protein